MQLTPNYNLKKPEGTDQVDIQDFNDNADIMDAELKKKADSTGGDVSNMTIKTLEEPTGTQFPVPEAGESSKTFFGKVRKFMNDFKSWNTGVCMIGQIVNNCVTNNDKLPLSAAQGKVLMDLYSVLNSNKANNTDFGIRGSYINFKEFKICWGTDRLESSNNALGTTSSKNINLPITYNSTPAIMHSQIADTYDGNVLGMLRNKGTNIFEIYTRVIGPSTPAQKPVYAFCWIAVGK